MDFRDYLRDWLAVPGRSAYKLSLDSGVSQSVISRYVHHDERRRVQPTPESLRRLAPFLGAPYEDLMRMCGYLEPAESPEGLTPALEAQVDAELQYRTERLTSLLSPYPRAFWSVVLDAAEKMAALPDAIPPVSPAAIPPVSRPGVAPTRRSTRGNPPITHDEPRFAAVAVAA